MTSLVVSKISVRNFFVCESGGPVALVVAPGGGNGRHTTTAAAWSLNKRPGLIWPFLPSIHTHGQAHPAYSYTVSKVLADFAVCD